MILANVLLDGTAMITVSGATAVMGAVWYLSARLQRTDDKLDEIQRTLSNLPCLDQDSLHCTTRRK